jgi:hypothetical protein
MIEETEYYWIDVPNWWDSNCPTWWTNFEAHCREIFHADPTMLTNWHLRTIINYELGPYGGKYKHRNTSSSIRFNDESGYTMFLLRWS